MSASNVGSADYAQIHHQRVHAARQDQVAHERVLRAFGIERADEEDRLHLTLASSANVIGALSERHGSSQVHVDQRRSLRTSPERGSPGTPASSSPALYVPCTTFGGICAMSPGPSRRFSRSTHCSASPEIT